MSQFKFRLKTLLKMRESVRDQRRAQLAQAFRAEQALQDQTAEVVQEIEQLRADVRNSKQNSHVNVDALLDANRYEMLLEARRQRLVQQVATVVQEIERRRASLAQADRQCRVLEKLRENQQTQHAYRQAIREVKEMDEIASHGGRRATP